MEKNSNYKSGSIFIEEQSCVIVFFNNYKCIICSLFVGSSPFSRKHPLACWIASMMLCFAGGILGNFLVGEPIITPFKDHHNVLIATAVWYVFKSVNCITYV